MERRFVTADSFVTAVAEATRSGILDAVFITRRLPDGSGWSFTEVFEGERPLAHIPAQIEGRWADFTAELRAHHGN